VYDDIAPDDAPTGPVCTCCGSNFWAEELGRQACFRCQDAADEHLKALAGPTGLYARLPAAMMPGKGGDNSRVSGSRTPPLPLRIEPLSLSARGGVVTILQMWAEDWHELMERNPPEWRGDFQQQCDQVVQTLRFNLEWAARDHLAFDEFSDEVRHMRRSCEWAVLGEPPELLTTVGCNVTGCPGTMNVAISTDYTKCPECGERYRDNAVKKLRAVERSAA
jgi:hypothetical protein